MSLILPTGLTHLVPSDGTLVPISYTDITTSSGTVGPLTIQVSNTSNTASALFSYSAELNPGPPPGPQVYRINYDSYPNPFSCIFDVTIDNGVATAVPISSSGDWQPNDNQHVGANGADIGGSTPANNINFLVTGVDGSSNPFTVGHITELTFRRRRCSNRTYSISRCSNFR